MRAILAPLAKLRERSRASYLTTRVGRCARGFGAGFLCPTPSSGRRIIRTRGFSRLGLFGGIDLGFAARFIVIGYDGGRNVRKEERQVAQEQPSKQIAGDRLLKSLGFDPKKWTVSDRLSALLGIGIGLTIVIVICGYQRRGHECR
jgi:hypothetical protein